MAIMDANTNGDSEIMRVWSLLNEVSDQLAQNRNHSIALHSLAGGVKAQAVHSQTGFVLRRFNLDKTQEEYNAELEHMNATMAAENNTLLNDNKQLNALIKEFEQTLENIMSEFRTQANEVQQRELSLVRDYERKIIVRETEDLSRNLAQTTTFSTHLGRAGELLRSVMRALGGEDPTSLPPPSSPPSLGPPTNADDEEDSASEREAQMAAAEWALERESELARLEQENAFLRSLAAEHLGQSHPPQLSSDRTPELPRLSSLPKVSARTYNGKLGGRDVGPYGRYKKFEE